MSEDCNGWSALRLPLVDPILNTAPAALYEFAISRGEALLADRGQLVADTGKFTGRSPRDKFVMRDGFSEASVDWGSVNQPLAPEAFHALQADMFDAAAERRSGEPRDAERRLFVQELFVGSDPLRQRSVKVVSEKAWHALFVRNLFIADGSPEAAGRPGWTVLDLPSFKADPDRHGTRGTTAVAMDFCQRLVLIANTEYAGEIKKSIFTALNYELPFEGVLPMHCSANAADNGDVALFFGLSGTGKTTLSADPRRALIGDDEHGWSERGVFNFEGGCYAKVIGLDAAGEPEIHAASTRFGCVLENVVLDPVTRAADFADDAKTENTRSAYPLSFIPNVSATGRGGHPKDVVFLTADAFGVMPPISRLSPDQAMYHFLSGYTAKVAGTERGVTEPQATFSACFGAPFLPLPPGRYADMLGARLRDHGATVWLVNTGWTGGPYGVGRRIELAHTRALLDAALSRRLDAAEMRMDPVFGVEVPRAVPGVPRELLVPRDTWDDAEAFDRQAERLARMFDDNFARFGDSVEPCLAAAGPTA
jgi:phosphoenolpyruvate carboxykinase (ATP)